MRSLLPPVPSVTSVAMKSQSGPRIRSSFSRGRRSRVTSCTATRSKDEMISAR
jgi:hypothetical protein